jgi:hypothetical protein
MLTVIASPLSPAFRQSIPEATGARTVKARKFKLRHYPYFAATMSRRTGQPPPKARPYRDPPQPPLTLAQLRKRTCWVIEMTAPSQAQVGQGLCRYGRPRTTARRAMLGFRFLRYVQLDRVFAIVLMEI